ncbi:MAG: hypothetical protein K0B10_01295 [Vicingaceae bacterium]|nr:hypothetical protein [Vicingaceae bacterium]
MKASHSSSMKIPNNSIEVFDAPTRYLFQGKLNKIEIDNKLSSISFFILAPINFDNWAVGNGTIFEEIKVVVNFKTLIIGLLNKETFNVKNKIETIAAFQHRVFQLNPNFKDPLVDNNSLNLPLSINVAVKKDASKIKWDILEFIIPEDKVEIPLVRITISNVDIFDFQGNKLGRKTIESKVVDYYNNKLSNPLEYSKLELKELHNIKNSYEFHTNKLGNWYWFQAQFNTKNQHIKKSDGDLLRPLWVEFDEIKKDEYGYVESIRLTKVIYDKAALLKVKNTDNLWWLPPTDYSALIVFLSNELIHSTASNPFQELIDLYISQWELNDNIDSSFLYDLKKIIAAVPKLANHQNKSDFFKQLNYCVKKRNLIWL